MIKKKVKKSGAGKPVAVNGSKGPGYRPKVYGGNNNQDADSRFVWFDIPKGAENVIAVPLEDVYRWFIVHQYKSITDKYFGNKMFLSPRDPENIDEPSFVEEWINKSPEKRKNIIAPVKTIAVMTLWTPEGVPSRDDPNEKYQINGRKGIVIPFKSVLPTFDLEYKEAQRQGKDLRGMKFLVSRSEGEMSPRCGDSWRFRNRYKLEFIEKKLGLPQAKWALDWSKIIPAVTKKTFKTLIEELTSGGAVGVADDSDDIPF